MGSQVFFYLASFFKRLHNKTLVGNLFLIFLYRLHYLKLVPTYIFHY